MKGPQEKIWCDVCQDYIARSELRLWTGDDRYHRLCPGCGDDLLPSLSEAEYLASLGIVEEQDDCPDCGNTKACQHCYGRGYDPDAIGWQACPICEGDGICVHCRQPQTEPVTV